MCVLKCWKGVGSGVGDGREWDVDIRVEEGRHALLEVQTGLQFIPNDVELGCGRRGCDGSLEKRGDARKKDEAERLGATMEVGVRSRQMY